MTAVTQSCPGTIQLANALASGIGAESAAYAKMGQALDIYGNNMNAYAQDQYTEGQKMVDVTKVLTMAQWVTAILGIATVVVGGVVGVAVSGATTGVASAISAAVNGMSQALQGVCGAVQGGAQAYKSEIQGKTEMDSTAIAAYSKTSETDSNTIKNESQGVGKLGSAINTMLINEGAIGKQKITK